MEIENEIYIGRRMAYEVRIGRIQIKKDTHNSPKGKNNRNPVSQEHLEVGNQDLVKEMIT